MPQVSPFPTKDPVGVMMVGAGESKKLNMGAAGVVKTGKGRLVKIIIIAPGSTSGGWSVNDAATTGAAAAANLMWTLPYNGGANVAGAVFNLDIPFTDGLTLSAVPGGGSPIVNFVFE